MDAPLANFLPNSLDASLSLTPKRSRPEMVVTHFFLLRVLRSSTTCTQRGGARFLPGGLGL